MIKIQIIILIAAAISLFSSCTGEGRFSEKYFADIKLDGRYSIIGRFPFDPAVTPRTNCYKITYDDKSRPVLVQFMKAGKLGYGVEPYSSVQTRISYYDNYEIRESLNSAGEPVPFAGKDAGGDPSRIFSIRLDLNANDDRISLTNLNIKRKPYCDTAGVVKYLWTLDDHGRIIESVGINTDEDSVTDANWERERHYIYDEKGNPIEERFIGRSGAPCQTEWRNIAVIRMKYDADGNVVEKLFYDLFGNFSTEIDMTSISFRVTRDVWGQVTKKRRLEQGDEKDSIFETGMSTDYTYDEKGNQIEFSVRDSAGNVFIDSMTSVIRQKYDDKGNCIKRICCNADGSPATLTIAGFQLQPIIQIIYNDDGFPVERRNYNAEGELARGYWGHEITVMTYTYGNNGVRSELAYFDQKGRPATHFPTWNLSKIIYETDSQGRMILFAEFDTFGKCVLPTTHIAYDGLGNKIEEKDCDEDGRLMEFGRGALFRYGYNQYGYTLYKLVYDTAGNLTDSVDMYDPEGPDRKCKDEESFRIDSIARARYDSIYKTSWQIQNKE